MTVAIVCWIASRQSGPIAAILPIAIAAVGLLQLLPLPDWLLMRLSPVSAAAWKIASPGRWGTIAIDPAATAAGLRRLLLGLGTIGAVAALGRDSRIRAAISAAIAASCVLVVVIAYAIPSSKDDRVALGFFDLAGPIHYWKSPVHAPLQTAGFSEQDVISVAGYTYVSDSWINGDRIGPYVVSNQFAGGVCMMLPIGIALWLWWSKGRAPGAARIAAALAMAGVALHAVAAVAESRAGTASLVLALAALATLVVSSPLARRAWLTVTAAGCGAWLVMVAIMHGPARGLERSLPTTLQPWIAPLVADGRVWASQLAQRIFAASPVLGTGFGSYYGLSAHLDRRNPPWFFAHNDYFQLLAETGVVGGAIATACAVGLGVAGWRFFRHSQPPDRIRDAGYWAAVVGIAAHSAFDWNLHVPANGFLACVVTGLALSGGAREPAALPPAFRARDIGRRALAVALSAAYATTFVVLCRDAWSDTVQRRMRDSLAATRVPDAADVEQSLATAIAAGERLARWDPDNANVAMLVGQLKLHAAAAAPDSSPPALEAALSDAAVWLNRASAHAAVCRGMPTPDPRARAASVPAP